MDNDVDLLLARWESSYKKGLLSFWILLLLAEKPMYAYEMTAVIAKMSNQTIVPDEKSVYRALKRFTDNDIVSSFQQKSDIGPARRYFELTAVGRTLLEQFIQRNILIYQDPIVAKAIKHALKEKYSN